MFSDCKFLIQCITNGSSLHSSVLFFVLSFPCYVTFLCIMYFSYDNLLKRGIRIALRDKVNDSLITGLRVVDSILPVGRGQRQLILGDRYTGKSSVFISLLLSCSAMNILGSIDGFGTKRLFGLYVGCNQNLSKLRALISTLINDWSILILSSQSSSQSILSYMLCWIGIALCERIRDRGFDSAICFDDLSKHSRAYRQISLIQNKIPSRDAFPSDIFNVHSSLLERGGVGRIDSCYCIKSNKGSISAFPIIETIQEELSEFIATNVISITDGQYYSNRTLFNDSLRPAIDSGLSVSRIGSNAQCRIIKVCSTGIKNDLTNYRLASSLDSMPNIMHCSYHCL